MTALHDNLKPYALAMLSAGNRVYILRDDRRMKGSTWFLANRDDAPGSVSVQLSDMSWHDGPIEVSARVRPSREFGSGVHVDFDGGPSDLPATVAPVIASRTIMPRFVDNPRPVQAVREVPKYMTEVTATDLA